MRFSEAFIIGVGGTGSHLLEPLARLLAYHPNGTRRITVIDGDSFEENNEKRQLFDPQFIGVNKAEAAARRLPWLGLNAHPHYVNGQSFRDLLESRTKDYDTGNLLVVMAVDNHATRKDVIMALDTGPYKNFMLFSPGNSLAHGDILVHCVRNGHAITNHPFARYPDLLEPKDKIPGMGCEAEAVATPQLITANASAALGVLLSVSAMLDGKPWHEEIKFHCEKLKLVPIFDAVKFKDEEPGPVAAVETEQASTREIVPVAATPVEPAGKVAVIEIPAAEVSTKPKKSKSKASKKKPSASKKKQAKVTARKTKTKQAKSLVR